MNFSKLRTCLAALVVASLFSGCASFNRIAPYPQTSQTLDVSVVPKPMSKMTELPLGAYYDGQRQVIVTGHQKGLLTGMLFGPVGVLVAGQANQSSAEKRFSDDTSRTGSDLGSILAELIADADRAQRAPAWTLKADGQGRLRLSPYAVFTVDKTGIAQLHALLRAEILGPDNKPAWSVRYFARAPGEYRLDGEDGWMEQERFSTAIRTALQKSLAACIDDTHGRLKDGRKITAKGRYAYLNAPFELRAIVAGENPDELIARLVVGDAMVLAGTHVLTLADFEIKDAKFNDPR
jgi:hypothetical protein